MAQIELPEWINAASVERAHAEANRRLHRHDESWAQSGMRAARDRNPKLLLALEKGAEVMDRLEEEQHGRTRRDAASPFAHRVPLTEPSLWREAYRLADAGNPIENLMWIYGAAAHLAGLIT